MVPSAHRSLTRLTRLAARRAAQENLLAEALRGRWEKMWPLVLDVAMETGDPIGSIMADFIGEGTDAELARQIMDSCDEGITWQSVPLQEIALAATHRVLRHGLSEESEALTLYEAGLLLVNLANRFVAVGRHEDGLWCGRQGVDYLRRAEKTEPGEHTTDLGMALGNLSIDLAEVGEYEEALRLAEEAVELYRGLFEEDSWTYGRLLANSLNDLSLRLENLGRFSEAIEAGREAVSTIRETRSDDPAHLQTQATCLSNLAAQLSSHAEPAPAIGIMKEAIEILRQLAAERPDVFLEDLASGLVTQGKLLSDAARESESREAIEEAVEIFRQLTNRRPASFRQQLGVALISLGDAEGTLGHPEAALRATDEGIQCLTQSVREPEQMPVLAVARDNRSQQLLALGRTGESLEEARKALQIHRNILRQTGHHPLELATQLANLSHTLAEAGQPAEALEAVEEAEAILRDSAETEPTRVTGDLAMVLMSKSNHLGDLGRHEEALEVMGEAVASYRELAEAAPEIYDQALALSLTNRGILEEDLGDSMAALESHGRALQVYRRLVEEGRHELSPELAACLQNMGASYETVENFEQAASCTREAGEIFHRLAARAPTFERDAARCWMNLSSQLHAMGRSSEALNLLSRNVAILRSQNDRSVVVLADLANALNTLGILCSDIGLDREAFEASRESVEIYREILETNPISLGLELSQSLNSLAHDLASAQRHAEALECILESNDLLLERKAHLTDADAARVSANLENLVALEQKAGWAERPPAGLSKARAQLAELGPWIADDVMTLRREWLLRSR